MELCILANVKLGVCHDGGGVKVVSSDLILLGDCDTAKSFLGKFNSLLAS